MIKQIRKYRMNEEIYTSITIIRDEKYYAEEFHHNLIADNMLF